MVKNESIQRKIKSKDNWMQKNWRPVAAFVYLLICLTDFVFMPAWYQYLNSKNDRTQHIELALKFSEPASQIEALKQITTHYDWKPLTLDGTGMVHLSFLAILGVAAWTRGQEKVKRVEKGVEDDEENSQNG
jgi:hypothetical protein